MSYLVSYSGNGTSGLIKPETKPVYWKNGEERWVDSFTGNDCEDYKSRLLTQIQTSAIKVRDRDGSEKEKTIETMIPKKRYDEVNEKYMKSTVSLVEARKQIGKLQRKINELTSINAG